MILNLKNILIKCINFKELNYKEIHYFLKRIIKKKISKIMLTAIIIALKIKKESINEIYYAYKILRFFFKIKKNKNIKNVLTFVGTGGDNFYTFNISTACMFIISSCKINVIKYGNRNVSSSSGSADVLELLGINIYLNLKKILKIICNINIAFIYAPYINNFVKYLTSIRRKLKIKTIFNILNSLISPVKTKYILLGVNNKSLINIQIKILRKIKFKRFIIYCGKDKLDEITLSTKSIISECINNKIYYYRIHPNNFNIKTCSKKKFIVSNILESKNKIIKLFNKRRGSDFDIVNINSALALYTTGLVSSIKNGILKSSNLIQSKNIINKIKEFIYYSNIL